SIVFLSTYFSIIYTPIFTPILIRSSEPNKYSLTDILFLPAGCISVILILFLLLHCTINPSLFFLTICSRLLSYSLFHCSFFCLLYFISFVVFFITTLYDKSFIIVFNNLSGTSFIFFITSFCFPYFHVFILISCESNRPRIKSTNLIIYV